MKYQSLLIASVAVALAFSIMLAGAQCYVVVPDGSCGGPPVNASCANDCVYTSYSVNGPGNDCWPIAENGCGSTECNLNSVTIWKYETSFEKDLDSKGNCIACCPAVSDTKPMQDVGCCERDTVGGSQCGSCN